MAEVTLPAPSAAASWLDRPLWSSWQRVAGLAINWEVAAYAAILLAGFLIRIWDVGARAMHHDESLHAYYAWQLFAGHGYTYDPLMHGPLQFEVVPVFYLLFGVGEFAARLLAVLLGTVLIVLPYFLRRYLTIPGALLTSLMLAVSPAFVYFSRFIRDDIYLACFSLLLFIAITRYMEHPRPHWLYIGAASAALDMASMEAAYITFFIFGTFLIFQALRERLTRPGPLFAAIRATSTDTWLMALAIFVGITVLTYSTFFTNPYGIWDSQHSLLSPDRKDILGGLTYWKAQHAVQRGGQPWFYYLLLLPLYEQLALLFGAAGVVLCWLRRRSLFTTFLAWWAVMAFGLYSWAGEKMPWLVIHVALPLILLAGLFLGTVILSRRTWALIAAGVTFLVLLVVEVHSMVLLNYFDGANPTEMLVYVQTSQDVPNVAHEIQRMPGWPNIPVGLDDTDVGGWPFTWYLHDDPQVTETSSFSGPSCGGQYCPVLLMLEPQYDKYGSALMSRYVVQKYRWNWWFPEDYKDWFPQHWDDMMAGRGSILGTSTDWLHVWNWLVFRQPFGDRGARWLYMFVRRDLVPGARYFSTTGPGGVAPPVASTLPRVPFALAASLTGGRTPLYGPRGIAADQQGNLFVADTLNHRVVEFGPTGSVLRAWGTAGTGPGQFSSRDSPQGLAVGPDGNVYVADTWNQRIEVFTPSGRLIRSWGGGPIGPGPGQFYGPRSVAVSSSGRVYVADTGNERIQVFSRTGKFLTSWGTKGTAPGQFDEPSSVAVDRRGLVYVADFWNRRIQVFSATGSYVRSWAVTDWVAQSYDEPYLAVDPTAGHVFAADPPQQQILQFTNSGQLLGAVASGSLSLPIGVAVEPGQRVAASDPTANKIDIFALKPGAAAPQRSPARRAPAPGGKPKKP